MSLLDTCLELLLLRLIKTQALVANVFPSKQIPSPFLERPCGIEQNPDERALVGPRRFAVLPGHGLNLGLDPGVFLQRVFGPHDNQCDRRLIRNLAALAREEHSLDALLASEHSLDDFANPGIDILSPNAGSAICEPLVQVLL